MRQTFKLLSQNLGGIRISAFGIGLYDPVKHVDARIAAFAGHALPLGADMICLQEVKEGKHFDLLREHLAPLYPYAVGIGVEDDGYSVQSGLCVFSRHDFDPPTIGMGETPSIIYGHAPLDEYLFARKGAIAVHLDTPLGRTAVINTHLVSGGWLFRPDGARMRRKRRHQLDDLSTFALAQQADARIIVGDLNCGPASSEDNYSHLLQRGWTDAWAHAPDQHRTCRVTWERGNPLNEFGHDPTSVSERIDHVFIQTSELRYLRVLQSDVVFDKAWVALGKGKTCPLSDHYGLLTTFARR